MNIRQVKEEKNNIYSKVLCGIISFIIMSFIVCCGETYAVQYVERKVNPDNIKIAGTYYAIQYYLDEAKMMATDDVRYKIVVPKGSYCLERNLNIYSNTWLYLEEGTVIKKCFTEGTMLKNGVSSQSYKGYDAFKNIRIEGGTWDGNCFNDVYGKDNARDFSNIRIGHASNVELINVNIINNKGGHHIEFGGVDGLKVTGCSFKGYYSTPNSNNDAGGKEALQLDVVHNDNIFFGYQEFDDSQTKNVIIENNTFENVFRGVGSHSVVLGRYYDNIIIRNNKFTNIKQQAIIAYGFKNSEISNNTMVNVGTGIDFRYMTSTGSNFYMPNDANEEIKLNDNANTVIKNNSIQVIKNSYITDPCGIRLYGYNNTSSSKLKKYNYKITNVKVISNKITSTGKAIRCDNVHNSLFENNSVATSKSLNNDKAIAFAESSYNKIIRNKLTSSGNIGIYIFTNSKNNIISNNSVCGAKDYAIKIFKNSTNNTISSNTLCNSLTGIGIAEYSSAIVTKNKIYKNKNYGIHVYRYSFVNASNNNISSHGAHGISITNVSSGNKITSNVIKDSKKNGIYLEKVSKSALKSNSISSSGYSGIYVGSNSSNNSITNNILTDNKTKAINIYNASKCGSILDKTTIIGNKGLKITAKGQKGCKIYIKYSDKVISNGKISSKGTTILKVAKKYKGKKVSIYTVNGSGNIARTYCIIK